jgi:hypothetical protein
MQEISVSSPTTERKTIENDQLRDEWSGCCSKSNKEFVKYITQIGFGASVVIFSMVQISRDDVESREIYFSLLSGTLGLFLPHPHIKSEQK